MYRWRCRTFFRSINYKEIAVILSYTMHESDTTISFYLCRNKGQTGYYVAAKHLLCWHFGANLILSNTRYFHRAAGAMTLYYLNVAHVLVMWDMKLIDLMTIAIVTSSFFYEKCPFVCPDYIDLLIFANWLAFELEKWMHCLSMKSAWVCAFLCVMLFDLSNTMDGDYRIVMHKLRKVKVNGMRWIPVAVKFDNTRQQMAEMIEWNEYKYIFCVKIIDVYLKKKFNE